MSREPGDIGDDDESPTRPEAPRGQQIRVEVGADAPATREELLAQIAVNGDLANAMTTITYAQGHFGEASATQAVDSLRQSIAASKRGDLGIADGLLVGQAVSLNAIFNEMMRRAANNVGVHPEMFETYMRLGLRAQNQTRTTLESLAKIKNPPNATFVKQANIAGGHQQVNNGCGPARTQETRIEQNELLEANRDGEWLDAGKAGGAGRRDSEVETVGAIDRTEDRRRKGAVESERVEGGRAAKSPNGCPGAT